MTFHSASNGDNGCLPRNNSLHKIMSTTKFDPSFKSKRYRDKIRTAVKELEALLPVDRSSVHRKLDSQTVFRLTIAHFRTKLFLEAAGLSYYHTNASAVAAYHCDCLVTSGIHKDCAALYNGNGSTLTLNSSEINSEMHHQRSLHHLQQQQHPQEIPENDTTVVGDGHKSVEALGGFVLIVTSDGTILYVSNNILQHLGFNQVDLMLRCIYGIVHPDDHQELKIVLENSLSEHNSFSSNQSGCMDGVATCRMVSFLCRIKCFNGTTAGYLKMHCMGHMRSFPHITKSQRTSNQVLFAFCRPFVSISADHVTSEANATNRNNSFWTKHELDMKIKQVDDKLDHVIGYNKEQLVNQSFYSLVHPEDLPVVSACHRALLQNEEVQTTYFRLQHQDGRWIWLHTRCKILTKNSRKYAINCAHCIVREEDSTYIQQEAALRQRYSFHELATGQFALPIRGDSLTTSNNIYCQMSSATPLRDESSSSVTSAVSLHDPHGYCPSSWHAATDRHSPVFPVSQLPSGSTQHYKQYSSLYSGVPTSDSLIDCCPYDNSRVPSDCSWHPALSVVTSTCNQRVYLSAGGVPSEPICYPAASERLKSMASNLTADRAFVHTQGYGQNYLHSGILHSNNYLEHTGLASANYSTMNVAEPSPASVKNNNYFTSNNCYYNNQQFSEQSVVYSQLTHYQDNNYYHCQLPVNVMTVTDS